MDVQTLVTRQGFLLALVGIVVGLVAAAAGTRVLSTVLYGIDAVDVSTYAGTALLLLLVAAMANWVPARRAASVNPVSSLRDE